MAQGGRKGNTFTIPVFLFPISLSLSLSLCLAFSFPFCPGIGKEVRREWSMGREDIGVHKGDLQLRTLWRRWSSGWALSDVVRGLVN
jgi:hypothetical protein